MYRAREERQRRPLSAGSNSSTFEVRSRHNIYAQSNTPCEEMKSWMRGFSGSSWALRQKHFTTTGRFGDQHTWAWWPRIKCEEAGILLPTADGENEVLNNSKRLASVLRKSVQVRQPWTLVTLKELFEQHGVDHKLFVAQANPERRTLQQLTHELQTGDCYFRVSDKKLLRVVDHVVMRLHAGEDSTLLIVEVQQGTEKGLALPRGIRRPHEDVITAAQRVLDKDMGLNPAMFKFKVDHFEHIKEKEEADASLYPGLHSVHLKHFVDADLVSTEPAQLELIGVPGFKDFITEHVVQAGKEGFQERVMRFYTWMLEATCWENSLHTRGLRQKSDVEICSVPVEAPWTSDALNELFFAKGIDSRQYGHGEAKTLEKFGQELSKGRSYLMSFDRILFRMIEVLDVHVHSLDGQLLVETRRVSPDGAERMRNLFPGLKREALATWAIRDTVLLILQDLNFHPGSLDMEVGDEILLEKDTKVYPAVKNIFRKQIIHLYIKTH